jgi:hypothetical protein
MKYSRSQRRKVFGTERENDMGDIAGLINKFGFPIVAAFGLGYFIYYVWTWVTNEIKPVTGEASKTLVDLIDRIRMLDNDLIRLNQKVNVILALRESGDISPDNKKNGSLEDVKASLKKLPEGTATTQFKQ